MVRNLYLVVVMAAFLVIAILVSSSAWKIWSTAFKPLMQALSGIH
jgi:hypothetical protein